MKETLRSHMGIATGAFTMTALMLLGGPIGAAGAADESVTTGFASLQTMLTGTIAPAVFGLAVAAVGIVLGVRWLRKAAASA